MNLNSKRVLIKRPRAQAEQFAAALLAEGAQPIFPMIDIIPPDDFSALDFAIQNKEYTTAGLLTVLHSLEAL